MRHSWTGGQYSAWRALFAVGLAIEGYEHVPWILLCSAFALGIRDRLCAVLLAVVAVVARYGEFRSGVPLLGAAVLMLLLHAVTHGAPYGSFDARGRADPGGNWLLPRWNLALRRFVVLAAAIACLSRGQMDVGWPLAVALALAACDPGWIPPARAAAPARVFYDGNCGLCHRFVRLILAEDLTGRTICFAPLDSDAARKAIDERERASLPDSVVVKTAEGETLVRARGTLHILARLGGIWRLVAALLRVLPRSVLDFGYDFVARIRHRIFARADTACPIVPRHLAARFDV